MILRKYPLNAGTIEPMPVEECPPHPLIRSAPDNDLKGFKSYLLLRCALGEMYQC